MTPIERVQRRAAAASRLNVSIYCTAEELRDRWRRIEIETHPDRTGDDDRAFRECRAAYLVLAETAPETGTQMRSWRSDTGCTVTPRRVTSRSPSRRLRPAG